MFGPVSIKALKEDQYTRKTEAYLPKAEFAFLDEIWKSSPAILNTLLTLINERVFRNGEVVERAPLKALIAASNETPEANQGLEALYDRFIIRLLVGPISQGENFDRLLNSKPTDADIEISEDLVVKPHEWIEWRSQSQDVTLSPETLTIIHLIRSSLAEKSDELEVYVSDRRWQRAAMLMKASAFFNGRGETNHSDAVLLKHCLWTREDNRHSVIGLVEDALREAGFDSGFNLAEMDKSKDDLDKEINHELFHTADVYETKLLNEKEYFFFKADFKVNYSAYKESKKLYVPREKLKSKQKFHPLDARGNKQEDVWCKFDGQGTCSVSLNDEYHYRYGSQTVECTPKILFRKGDKKQDINIRLVESLSNAVSDLKKELEEVLRQVESKSRDYQKVLSSPFISEADIQLVLSGITEQIDSLKLRIKDCERLEELCR